MPRAAGRESALKEAHATRGKGPPPRFAVGFDPVRQSRDRRPEPGEGDVGRERPILKDELFGLESVAQDPGQFGEPVGSSGYPGPENSRPLFVRKGPQTFHRHLERRAVHGRKGFTGFREAAGRDLAQKLKREMQSRVERPAGAGEGLTSGPSGEPLLDGGVQRDREEEPHGRDLQ